MEDLLIQANAKYFLKLGDTKFSPVTEISSYMSLQYCDLVERNKTNCPFIISLPEKKYGSLWISIGLLLNNFYEDHINNELSGIEVKKGDRVQIFNTIAEVQRATKDKVFLKFRDQNNIPINKRLQPQISIVNKRRSLNLFKRFRINYKEFKVNRNAISKILEPNDSVIINQENLKSKVLLVAGRGNTKYLKEILNNSEVMGTSLSKIFQEEKNLIIKPDFESFKQIFDNSKDEQFQKFGTWLTRFKETISDSEIAEKVGLLLKILNSEGFSINFDSEFLEFYEYYHDNELIDKKLEKIYSLYPGPKEALPEELRAVVINDIYQLLDYKNVVNGFLKKKIPVIVITDRSIIDKKELNFYTNLFKNHPELHRFNWNKAKCKHLITNDLRDDAYLDEKLWRQVIRYANQEVRFNISKDHPLDLIIPVIQQGIQNLEEFEELKKSYYYYFYPVLYAIKNSKTINSHIQKLVDCFDEKYQEVRNLIPYKELVASFDSAIEIARINEENTKDIVPSYNVFTSLLSKTEDGYLNIPVDNKHIYIPSFETNKVIFNGYPYNEYSGRYLVNTVCKFFVPEVLIKCWPNEAITTYNYLKRRILAGYFTDLIPKEIRFPKKYIINNETDFNSEVDTILILDNNKDLDSKFNHEVSLDYIHGIKYRGYTSTENEGGSFKVKCDILNFTDGTFMFLPNGGRILAERENNTGSTKILNSKFSELNIGLRIFKYKKDRTAYRNIAKQNIAIHEAMNTLDIWKSSLEELYKNTGENIQKLEDSLMDIRDEMNLKDSNPSRQNIQRWLFDDETLSPSKVNLRLILFAGGSSEVEVQISKIDEAYSRVTSFTISLSSKIKKIILKYISEQTPIEDNFIMSIEGSEIEIESKIIGSLEKNDIEVDYYQTRKILC